MGRQGPAKKLVVKRPSSSLIAPSNVVPLILQILSCVSIQMCALIYLHKQLWFNLMNMYPTDVHNSTQSTICSSNEFIENVVGWENTVLFLISCYQYLCLGAIYSKGLPYRQPLHTNCKRYKLLFFFIAFRYKLIKKI